MIGKTSNNPIIFINNLKISKYQPYMAKCDIGGSDER
jgi:hypothetical protein